MEGLRDAPSDAANLTYLTAMNEERHSKPSPLPTEEHRRFEELWDGVDDPESRVIRLRDNDSPSPARRRNRLFYLSFILSALLLAAAIVILAKIYL